MILFKKKSVDSLVDDRLTQIWINVPIFNDTFSFMLAPREEPRIQTTYDGCGVFFG